MRPGYVDGKQYVHNAIACAASAMFAEYEPNNPNRSAGATIVPTIRLAQPCEILAIARLTHKRDGGSIQQHVNRLEKQLANTDRFRVAVALVENTVVAFARLMNFTHAEDAPANIAPQGWYLAGVIVDPSHRRRGIGLDLTKERMRWLRDRGVREAFYFANAENRATIALHERAGFVEVTRNFVFPGAMFSGRNGVGILFRCKIE